MNLKINFYTVLSGSYDIVLPVPFRRPGVLFSIISPARPLLSCGWNYIYKPSLHSSDSLYNRHHKIIPPSELCSGDVLVYLDSNMRINLDFLDLCYEFFASSASIGLFPHPLRDSFYLEASHLKAKFGSIGHLIDKEIRLHDELLLLHEHEPSLTENGVIFRRISQINNLMHFHRIWFSLTKAYSGRDQLSLLNARLLLDPLAYQFSQSFRNYSSLRIYPHSGGSLRHKLRSIYYCYFKRLDSHGRR
jgi:hypothetical protein